MASHRTTLGRQVAVKVLLDAFGDAAGPWAGPESARASWGDERLARFEREARTLASLNHPNIATVYGLETREDVRALVMELVEGQTLAEWIASGPIPIDEALPIARQIADALEAAHEHGIVHRDLKPANVMVRPDGTVKVLDFGLAKALDPGEPSPDATQSPTITSPAMTRRGVILGTAAYMAPEQAKGRPADTRSDVWAFGCVLFEMLTGRRAFAGDDVTDTLTAVLRDAPDWATLPRETPASVRRLLERCLRKDARERLPHIGVARMEILEALTSPGVPPTGPTAVPRARRWPWVAAIIGASAATAALTISFTSGLFTQAAPVVRIHETVLPDDVRFSSTGRHLLALSPDGRYLAYSANNQLNLRTLGQLESVPIPGTQGLGNAGGRSPFFSPDGQWVGFWQDDKLKKAPVAGGPPLTVCDANNPWGASWGEDNIILYGQGPDGIWRVSADGGTPERIIRVEPNEIAHGPQALPAGHVLFTVSDGDGNWNDARIVVERLADSRRTEVVRGGTDARYLPTGHLVYYRSSELFAAPFNVSSMSLTGPASRVAEDVELSSAPRLTTGAAHYTVSNDGLLAYVPNRRGGSRQLVWVDRQGRETAVSAPVREYQEVRLSPDGTKAVLSDSSQRGVSVWDFGRETLTQLTSRADGLDLLPVWMPDGKTIVFGRDEDVSGRTLYRISADGAGAPQPVLDPGGDAAVRADRQGVRRLGPSDVTRDGTVLVADNAEFDLYIVRLRGDLGVTPLLASPKFSETNPSLSPDDRWITYQSSETGREHVFVRSFPEVDKVRSQISITQGFEPLWSPTGREIFYRDGDTDRMMAVPVEAAGSSFKPGRPIALFPWNYVRGRHAYDVIADGQRFLMIRTPTTSSHDRIVLVENWFEEVKRVAPTQ